MRTDLIIALRDKMRSLQPHQFDINDWANECGTVACGAGWACTMPEFQEAGLKLSLPNRYPVFSDPKGHFIERTYDAMACGLGIVRRTSLQLFSPESYEADTTVTPNKLANRLQFLLDHGEAAFIEHFSGVGE